jgi:DNA-binding protein HU-beta
MNKNDLAVQMVKDSGITKVDALKTIDSFIEVVSNELKNDSGKLTLVGFGTFKTITKKKKKGRNPRTGTEIIIPKKRAVKFVPGKKLKEVVNQ